MILLHVGVKTERLVAVSSEASSHVGILNAQDVVLEVHERHVTVGRLNVVHVLAGVRFPDFRHAHLIGDVGASCHENRFDGFAHRGVGAALLSGAEEVLTVGQAAASQRVGPFHVLHFGDVFGGSVGVPGHFHLPAFVAEVTRHGGGEDDFVETADGIASREGSAGIVVRASQVIGGAWFAFSEEDELNAVEAQERLSEFLSGIGVAREAFGVILSAFLVGVHGSNLCRVGQCHCQALQVERPGVDVRVDAEVAGCAIEERLAGFIDGACAEERLASLCHLRVGQCFRCVAQFQFDGVERVEETGGGVRQQCIGRIDRAFDVLFVDGGECCHFLVFFRLGGVDDRVVVTARDKRDGGSSHGEGEHQVFGVFHVTYVFYR